tara:strand:- start:194 stop:430 length:237 start_codon:yes stop_codon:yes gene_type:complete
MKKYPRIIGWSVVIVFWSITGCALEQMKHGNIVEASNTAEDMIEWIEHDLEAGKIDSTTADTYIDNLEEIIIDLRVKR